MNMRLLCLPVEVKNGIKNLERRDEVPEEVYSSEVMMEHPAIPGLMLSLEERIYGGHLEIWKAYTEEVRDETLGEVRDETPKEKPWRVQWKKPIARSESRTDKDHVPMNMGLFKKHEKEKPKKLLRFYEVQALKEAAAKVEADRELEEAQALKAAVAKVEADRERVAAIMAVEDTLAQCAVAKKIQEMPAKVQSAADAQGLGWLEQQLANVVAQLIAIMTDNESGLSVTDLRFSCDEDIQELIEEMGNVIAKLKSKIQTLKEVKEVVVGVER